MRQHNRRPANPAVRGVPSRGGAGKETAESGIQSAGAAERFDSPAPILGVAPVVIPLPGVRCKNPLNGSQGFSRGATMAEARRRKEQRELAQLATRGHVPKLGLVGPGAGDLKADVTLVRVSPRQYDDEGWIAAAKSLRDGVADAFGVADNHPMLGFWYEQLNGKPKEYGVRIEIRFERVR